MIRSASVPRVRLQNDYWLFAMTLALVVLGLWMVFDTSYIKTLESVRLQGDTFYYVKRQAVGAVAGMFALFAAMHFGYWRLKPLAVPMVIVGFVLLLLVFVPPIGFSENNASRWIKVGPLSFQPSEIAKLTLIVYVAAILSRPNAPVRHLTEGLGPPLIVTGLYLLAIEREPDLGTAIVLFLTILTVLFVAGARKRHIALILAGVGLVVAVFAFGFSHRGERLRAFLDAEKHKTDIGFQVTHARRAVGSGQIWGVGLGRGKEKYYLPQANTDFIFSTLAEELGFVRTVAVLSLMFLVGWRGFRIALQTKDRFGALLAAGISGLICWQALINIGVATTAIPATGVPLPFLSYGSTALVTLMAGIGLLLNIAQYPTPPVKAISEKPTSSRR